MRSHLLLLLLPAIITAQQTGWDTTRYQKFRSNLIIGVFQSYRIFNNQFTPLKTLDTGAHANDYYAESRQVTGIEINYDKFSLSLGLTSTPRKNSTGKGNTTAFNANLNFGGNIWYSENYVRSFKGFYDANSRLYDTSFAETGKYYYLPDFVNVQVRSKYLYFLNHKKYSFRSNYACNYRQLKTGASWILGINTNYNYLHNDSSFFPPVWRGINRDYANMNGLNVFGISANGGAAFTIVWWKAFFFHMMLVAGPEQQWRSYYFTDRSSLNISGISLTADFRASIGLNFKRAYILWASQNDISFYSTSILQLMNRSVSGSFLMGWRFTSTTPKFYKRFQNTRLYRAF